MKKSATKERIVGAADNLFYRHGFDHTSFKTIAEAVNISRGNFYYHFNSKDEILNAVISQRLMDTQKMLEQWEKDGKAPEDRIRNFIHILIENREDIKQYGCPVGTLRTELAKLNHEAQEDSNALFALFRSWLCGQFQMLGCAENSDAYAMHLLARSQGVATLANAFQDEVFIRNEVDQMCAWLRRCARNASKQRNP